MTNDQIPKFPGPLLEGYSVRLRAVEPADVDFIYTIENDTSVWHLGHTLLPYSRYQIEQYVLSTEHDIYSERQLRLIIETRFPGSPGKNIGTIDIYDFDPYHRRAGVGILIIEEERQKGFASESLKLLIPYCFDILSLHQLYCCISAYNTNSIQLFRNAGFLQCGLKKDWRLEKEQWIDEIMLQLIKS